MPKEWAGVISAPGTLLFSGTRERQSLVEGRQCQLIMNSTGRQFLQFVTQNCSLPKLQPSLRQPAWACTCLCQQAQQTLLFPLLFTLTISIYDYSLAHSRLPLSFFVLAWADSAAASGRDQSWLPSRLMLHTISSLRESQVKPIVVAECSESASCWNHLTRWFIDVYNAKCDRLQWPVNEATARASSLLLNFWLLFFAVILMFLFSFAACTALFPLISGKLIYATFHCFTIIASLQCLSFPLFFVLFASSHDHSPT